MSNIFTEAIAHSKPLPSDEGTSETIKFLTDFIKEYGGILKEDQILSFKFLITTSGYHPGKFHVILKPSDCNYGSFFAQHHQLPYGAMGLTNILKNNGAKVTFDEKASKFDETYDHYLVEFPVNK